MPLDSFTTGFGQRFNFNRMQVKTVELHATLPDGKRFELQKPFEVGGLTGRPRRRLRREALMARLKSELEVKCPCCHATLVIDTNLGRIVSHEEPDRGNKPELSNAQGILAQGSRAPAKPSSSSRWIRRKRGEMRCPSDSTKRCVRRATSRSHKPVRDFDLD